MDRLYNMFKTPANTISTKSFLTALTLITHMSPSARIRAAFETYDPAGRGYITHAGFRQYLTSLYTVVAARDPAVFEKYGVTPAELASVTGESAFREADTDCDGRIDWGEFKEWFSKNDVESGNELTNGELEELPPPPYTDLPLSTIASLTFLSDYAPSDIFDMFASTSPEGLVSYESFKRCLDAIAGQFEVVDEEVSARTFPFLLQLFTPPSSFVHTYVRPLFTYVYLCL